jgi:signal transduction histidine kinase
VTQRAEKFRLFVRNVVTGGMFDRYDIETTRRIIMLNVLIIAGILFLVAYSIQYLYSAAYRMAVIDLGAAVILVLTGIHVRRTQTHVFASNAAILILGVLFLYLTIVGGFNNTGYLWAFLFPLLSVIHFGLKRGTIAISLFLGTLIFFFASDYPVAASNYSMDFKTRFISSLVSMSIFAYVHEYIRIAFLKEIVRQNEELSRTQRLESLGFLAGGIAHDFNNILTGVIGNLGLLELSIPENNPNFKLVTAAKRSAEKSTDLTQQLMTFSRGGAPIKETTSIETLLRETT